MMLCSGLRSRIQSWFRDYDRIQSLAVILIYIQIGCALVGSVGALYNGVALINLAIGLFALVAIESSSQNLCRTYAVLLFFSIILDIVWFTLFTHDIWNMSSEVYGTIAVFSVKLTLLMQIIGLSIRLSSSFLWVQVYRLGVSSVDRAYGEFDVRNSFLSPATPVIGRNASGSDDALGGSVYDTSYYSSLFDDVNNSPGSGTNGLIEGLSVVVSNGGEGGSQRKPPLGKSPLGSSEENVFDKIRGV